MINTAALNYEANVLNIVNLTFNKYDDKQRHVATQQMVRENGLIGEPGEPTFHYNCPVSLLHLPTDSNPLDNMNRRYIVNTK
jgi:hypothetical protein